MLHLTYISGKKVSKVMGVVNQVTNRGGEQFCLQNAALSKTILVAKIQINWASVDQFTTLCAKWHCRGLKG